jgi:hypothetical protein
MSNHGARRHALLAALCLPLASAKLIDVHFNGLVRQYAHADKDMAYIGKFAFQCVGECGRKHGNREAADGSVAHTLSYEAGVVRVTAHGAGQPGQVIAVFLSENFYDPSRSWRHVFKNKKLSCVEKLAKAVDVIPITPPAPANASLTYNDEVIDSTVQRTEYIELSARPQFFHFAAMNCEVGSLYTYIELRLFNPGGFRTRQFSYEDQGLLMIELVFLIITLAMAALSLEGVRTLSSSRLQHPPLQILNNALWLHALSHVLALWFYNSYASHGRAPEMVLMSSELLFLSTDLIVMVLCLLIARGWRVLTSEFERSEAILVFSAAACYVLVYALVYCVDMVTRDPADDVYPLMTGGALWLVFFRLCLGGLCAYFVLRTYRAPMSVAQLEFYKRFMSFSVLWFLAQPLAILAALSLDEWLRHKNAVLILYVVTHGLLAVLLFTLRPVRAKSYFKMTAYEDELDGLVAGGNRGAESRDRSTAHEERFSRPTAAAAARYRDADDDVAQYGGGVAAGAFRNDRVGDELEMSERYRAESHDGGPSTPEPQPRPAPKPLPQGELMTGFAPPPPAGPTAAAAAAVPPGAAARSGPAPHPEPPRPDDEENGML